MDKTEGKSIVKKCVLIAAGAVVYAAGMGLFLSPNHLAPGGVTGIAVILNSVFEFPTGTTAFILNIPLFLIAIKVFGFRFFSTTLAATTLASLLIDVFAALPPLTDDLLLAAFAGGAMSAVGISLIFKAGATTGGHHRQAHPQALSLYPHRPRVSVHRRYNPAGGRRRTVGYQSVFIRRHCNDCFDDADGHRPLWTGRSQAGLYRQ